MSTALDMRQAIIDEAMSWYGTPYVGRSSQKGKGADCATFWLGVHINVGLIPEGTKPPEHHRMWILGNEINPYIFRDFILRWFDPVDWDNRIYGDSVTFMNTGEKRQRIESHISILQNNNTIIHSSDNRGVHRSDLKQLIGSVCTVYRHKDLL